MTAPQAGRATPAGTRALAERHPAASFYRPGWDGLTVSSVGLGTYLGEPDDATDERYAAAVLRYLALGGNLIDTAINYRFQRSERAIGAALQTALAAGEASRAEVIVCTKGGYVPFDGGWPADPDQWILDTVIGPGLAQPEEIVDGHCMAPAYLRQQISQSRSNLQLACIDLYYVHNPECQRAALGDEVFRHRLREAFAALEVAVAQGHIGAYGVATWDGFRAAPDAPGYLALQAILEVARDVSGERHHLRAIQLPINFQMVEAATRRNQPTARGLASVLEAAAELGVTVMASAPLLQGRLLGRLPDSLRAHFDSSLDDAGRAVQFVRSTPGVTAALAGMSRVEHVDHNLQLRDLEPIDTAAWRAIFQKA